MHSKLKKFWILIIEIFLYYQINVYGTFDQLKWFFVYKLLFQQYLLFNIYLKLIGFLFQK